MDYGPKENSQDFAEWKTNRNRVVQVLEENGFRYYRHGRVFPAGQTPEEVQPLPIIPGQRGPTKPAKIDELLEILLTSQGLSPLISRLDSLPFVDLLRKICGRSGGAALAACPQGYAKPA